MTWVYRVIRLVRVVKDVFGHLIRCLQSLAGEQRAWIDHFRSSVNRIRYITVIILNSGLKVKRIKFSFNEVLKQ